MKKKYEEPNIQVIDILSCVITASGLELENSGDGDKESMDSIYGRIF